MQHAFQFGAGVVFAAVEPCRQFGGSSLMPAPASGGGPRTRRRPKGHLKKPGTKGISNPERAGFLDQDQECGLKCVLRVVGVHKLRPTDAQNHRAVALDQRLKSPFCSFARAGREALE